MTTVASFTKTYREAQTYLTFVLLVPTLPLAFATMLNIEPEAEAHVDPEPEPALADHDVDQRSAARLACSSRSRSRAASRFGAVLGWLAVRLYRREAILG